MIEQHQIYLGGIMIKIAVVLGSTRQGRMGERIWLYLKSQAKEWEQRGVEFDFVDLKELDLPFFYEDLAPMMNKDRHLHPSEEKWLKSLESSDGFIFLTPEYNWATTAVLRNALDYVAHQMRGKAARTISYAPHPGGGFAGGRDLDVLLGKLGAFIMPTPIALRNVQASLDEKGALLPEDQSTQKVLFDAVDEVAFYAKLFKENPYKKAQ